MQNEVVIKKARKYYKVYLKMYTSYGIKLQNLYYDFNTYNEALDHATNVARANNYKLSI